MKKPLLPLLLVIPLLMACELTNTITLLNAEAKGHFTDVQLDYLNSKDYSNTDPYNGIMSVSAPLPVNITWESNEKISYSVEFFEEEDCNANSLIVTYETDETSFDFYNPIFGQDYYVRVMGYKDGTSKRFKPSNIKSFKETPTVKGPRNIYVEGVENFRDIGGWGYIKQGMLYRSGCFNEEKAIPVKVTISDAGIHEVTRNLKIKTEIDLRRTSNDEVGSLTDKSVLGDSVNYIQLPMVYGGNNILTFTGLYGADTYEYDNPAMIKRFFEILAVEDNYPINFHCLIGKDRTGCLAYLVEGLLGFDQETMYRDYMFTNFSDAGMCKLTDITDRYGKTIEQYENGESLQEKIYNYLNEVIGVSKDNLDSVINILKL